MDFQSDQPGSLSVGLTLMVFAAVVIAYALFNYYRRLKLLTSGSPYGYIDHVGPILLAVAVFVGIIVLLIYFYYAAEQNRRSDLTVATIESKPGICIQHNLQGVSLLEYQPSDVLVDTERNLLLIPSLSQINSIPINATINGTIKVHAEISGTDIECVTYAGSRLFAIAEGPKKSRLLEFKWESSQEFLCIGARI